MRHRGRAAVIAAVSLAVVLLAGCGAKVASTTPAKSSTTEKPFTFQNAGLLWETGALAQKLDSVRVVDARPAADYAAGHIQGAVSLPVDETFNPTGPKQMAGPADQIEKLLSARGIGNDTVVVVYDNGKDTKASRVFWTLEYYGQTKVSVLNGGFAKWKKENLPVSTTAPTVTPEKFTARANPVLLDTKDSMLAALNKPGVAIVDARSPQEYKGEDVRSKRGGHIPGAVNINWTDLFTGDDAPVFKPAAEIKKMYEDQGVTRDKDVHAY